MKSGSHQVRRMMGILLLAMLPAAASAQNCAQLLLHSDVPTQACAHATYFLDIRGSDIVDLAESNTGLLEAEFDGFDLFDPDAGLEVPDNMLEPWFGKIDLSWQADNQGRPRRIISQSRGALMMDSADNRQLSVFWGTKGRVTFVPYTIDDSTGPVTLDMDFELDGQLADPLENFAGSVSMTGTARLFEETGPHILQINGVASLQTDFETHVIWGHDFHEVGTSQPAAAGVEDDFFIEVVTDASIQVTPGQELTLETDVFGRVFLTGYDTDDTGTWTASSPNTFTLNLSSPDSNVRFELVGVDTEPPFEINAGLNDAWYNRATDGQGIFIIVYPDIQLVFLAWFTYEADAQNGGAPTLDAVLGDDEHRWLTAAGFYEEGDDSVELDISITRGGKFDAGDPISRETDGTIKLNFEHCDKVVAEYNIPSIERSGSVDLERVAKDNVPVLRGSKPVVAT